MSFMLQKLVSHVRSLADASPASVIPDSELLSSFLASRDELAFELLVWRHGMMVLNTCRRIIGSSADVEDAFQATFLTLIRKAPHIRTGQALAGWLHQVAHRVALRSRRQTAARSMREQTGIAVEAASHAKELDDSGFVLEQEIARLPKKLRLAFLLCHVQGVTNEQAAEQLGCPKGTVLSRLARARERLRHRLTRRGLAPLVIAGLLEACLPQLHAAQVASVVQNGLLFAAGTTQLVPAKALTLTQEVLRDMFLAKLKTILVACILLAAFVGGGLTLYHTEAVESTRPTAFPLVVANAPAEKPEGEEPKKTAEPLVLKTRDQDVSYVEEALFSRNGKLLIVAGSRPDEDTVHSSLTIWDARDGKFLREFKEPMGVGTALELSPDGKLLASANLSDNSITIFEVETWKVRTVLRDHPMVSEVRFGAGGKVLGSGSYGHAGRDTISEVRLWDLATNKSFMRLEGKSDAGVRMLDFSPDGKILALSSTSGNVRLIDAATGKERATLRVPIKEMPEARFSPKGNLVAVWGAGAEDEARKERTIELFDVESAKSVGTLRMKAAPADVLCFSPDGKHLASTSHADEVTLWDLSTLKPTVQFRIGGDLKSEVQTLIFSPDGKTLIASGHIEHGQFGPFEATSKVVSIPEGREVRTLKDIRSVRFSDDGSRIILIRGDVERTQLRHADEVTIQDAASVLQPKRR